MVAFVAVVSSAQFAAAQDRAPLFRATRVTIAAGAIVVGGYAIGDTMADLRRNTGGAAAPLPLLRAESAIDRVAGIDARLAVALTRSLALEVGGSYTTPQLTVRISQDQEADGLVQATERLSQYGVDVSALYLIARVRFGTNARPYLIGGAGYLRQLHEGRLDVETGQTIHAGGGVQFWLRGGANIRQRPFGARVEARLVRRIGGIDFEERSRSFPAVSALMFVGL
jgi:opacity protein-like surface antigen